MKNYIIEPMTSQELSIFNNRQRRNMVYAVKRTSGYKLFTEGQWHYGFVSEEQAMFAMEHRTSPAESYYVKEDVSVHY
jgi:hypothetical protein